MVRKFSPSFPAFAVYFSLQDSSPSKPLTFFLLSNAPNLTHNQNQKNRFNLFAVRTRRLSVLQHHMNWLLLPAIAFALIFAIFFLYVPKFHHVLQTAIIPAEYWFFPMAYGMSILLLDEGRKFLVRRFPRSWVARIAW